MHDPFVAVALTGDGIVLDFPLCIDLDGESL